MSRKYGKVWATWFVSETMMINMQLILGGCKLLSSTSQKFWQREEAASLVIMAFVLTVLLGLGGVAVDGSNIYYQTQRMQISADAAALGGARKLAANADYSSVNSEIRQLAIANAAEDVTWSYINNARGVHVVTSRGVEAYFAHIFGHDVFTVTAEAQAQYEPVVGIGGLFPFIIDCNCDSSAEDGGSNNSSPSPSPSPTPTAVPDTNTSPSSGTVQLSDSQNSSYGITYLGQSGNTWSYQVDEIKGRDLGYWLLNIKTCLSNIVSYTPSGAVIGTDSSSGMAGIKWNVATSFTSGTFSFTLDDSYPSGMVTALANAQTTFGTVSIRGPLCDGTNSGDSGNGSSSLCLPTLEFETDTAGAALVAGQIIDTEWAAWGVHITTHNPANHPAMIFNTANPTGGDFDLGAPNEAYGGPGIGIGGGPAMPGYNNAPLGKVLIVAESNNSSYPDDSANGGTLIFTFDYPVRIDDVRILDIDDVNAAGTIKAYKDTAGVNLIATGKMKGFGDNSVQTVAVNGSEVRRLEIKFPQSGAVASIVSCRSATQTTYRLGNLIWNDTDNDGIQDNGEPGIAGVKLELYISGQNSVIATAISNVGGEYVFNNLPNGNYELKIAASNFQSGGALVGATYSPKDATTDTLDSDFSASTGRAPVTIAGSDNLTVDGGFVLASPGPQSAIINVSDNKNSTYEIALVSVVANTWTYRVREVSGHNLDYWSLGIANCLDKVTSYSPTSNYSSGVDGGTGFNGMKWGVSNSFSDGTFSFTLDNSYQARPRQALVKSVSQNAQVTISGPDCSVTGAESPTPVPTSGATPAPTPSGSGGSGSSSGTCVCEGGDAGFEYGVEYTLHEPEANAPGNFGWIRWAGDNPSTTDLAYNIEHPEESDVLFIGDLVQGTTGIKNSSLVQTAFEQWIGRNITIPIYNQVTGNGSNVQYRVCTFATFKLTSYDRSSKTIKGIFVQTLLHSNNTDNSYPDVGARDVRFVN